jgi:hypothetical protein
MNDLKPWLKRNEMRAVTAVIVVAFALGLWGYYRMYFGAPENYFEKDRNFSYWDVLYSTLRLYVLEADGERGSGNWPASIQVARILAALGIGWAAIRAGLSLLSKQIKNYKMSGLKGHVIVAGSDDFARRLINEYCNDHDVVHICPNASADTESNKSARIFTVEGDASEIRTLKTARLRFSERIFLASDVEIHNRAAAYAISDYLKDNRPLANGINCHMRLSGTSCSVRASKEILSLDTEQLTIKLFNPLRIAARVIMQDYGPHLNRLPSGGDKPLHVLVVEFGEIGQELVKQIIRVCHYTDCQKVKITIVDENNSRAWDRFRKETPAYDTTADITYENKDSSSLNLQRWDKLQNQGMFDAAYITTTDPDDAYALALDARDGLGSEKRHLQVMVCSHGGTSQQGLYLHFYSEKKIDFFDLTKSSWTREYICDENCDNEAKRIHRSYLGLRVEQNIKQPNEQDWEASPAELVWEKLPEYFRDANRDQADHNIYKNFILKDKEITRDQAGDINKDHPKLSELMAKMEHRRWIASLVIAGFRYGQNRDDDFKRTHPSLHNPELSFNDHYDQLDEKTKEYDREMILRFLEDYAGTKKDKV